MKQPSFFQQLLETDWSDAEIPEGFSKPEDLPQVLRAIAILDFADEQERIEQGAPEAGSSILNGANIHNNTNGKLQ